MYVCKMVTLCVTLNSNTCLLYEIQLHILLQDIGLSNFVEFFGSSTVQKILRLDFNLDY